LLTPPWNSVSKQVESAPVLRFEKFVTGFFTITVENVLKAEGPPTSPRNAQAASFGDVIFKGEKPASGKGCEVTNQSRPKLFLTRVADHFYVRNLHVTVLSITLFHAAVLRTLFRVFLHVVHFCI
jgi:hypothetical protein